MGDDNIKWYHGNLTREDAEKILLTGELLLNGRFLVRDSSTSVKDFVLSVYYENEIIHYQIRRHGEDAFFAIASLGMGLWREFICDELILDEETIIHGLDTLIEYYQEDSHGLMCTLVEPVLKDLPPHDTRRHGRTNLLHRATKQGDFNVASELLKCDYRLEAKDEMGQTAVHHASILGQDAILQILIDKGANVNCRDQMGNTPLHYACQNNLINTVRILLDSGFANVQIRNTSTGWVPLHEAASRGHKDIVEMLLLVGAPSRPRTNKNETPQMLAESNGYFQCGYVLKTYPIPTPKTSREQWYHGTLDRNEAINLLEAANKGDGSYLIRYSDHKGYVLTMLFGNKPYNFPIQNHGSYYVIDDGPYLDSLEHVVEHYRYLPDGLPTTLQHPIMPKPKPPLPNFHPSRSFPTLTLPHRRSPRKSEGNVNATLPMPPRPRPVRHSIDSGLNSSVASLSTVDISLHNSTLSLPFPPPDPQPQVLIPKENLILKDAIGEGEFGSVFRALYQKKNGDEEEVAVKTLRREHIMSNERDFLREAEVMLGLNHHCIVKLIGLSQGDTFFMVQELVSLGSILQFLHKHPEQVSPDYELLVWASQIASGMKYLDQNKIVHRDLAARNVLLATRHQAKISDFGLSRPMKEEGGYYQATTGGRWPIRWYAPESYNYGKFSSESDVWSFGVTLWEMFTYGEQPFGNLKGNEVIKLIDNGDRLPKPDHCKPMIYKMMERCWEYVPSGRPSFSELAEFFASLNSYENVRELITKTDIS